MFDWLYSLLGSMMAFFNNVTGHYALALLLYALVFKIVFLPFSIKQQKNQIKMAKLAPKIALIKAKYKGRTDQPTLRKQQEEIMQLQQQEGYSPMSGCLPLLIQLPLILLLYAVIQNPLSYIAKTTDTVKDYNESYDSAVLDEETKAHYGSITSKGEELTKDDIIRELLIDFHPDLKGGAPVAPKEEDYAEEADNTSYEEAYEAYREALDEYNEKVEKLLKGRVQIALIGYIDAAVESGEITAADVNAYGLDYASYPDFHLLGANLAENPSLKSMSLLTLIPFLTALVQWLSMFITRKLNGGASNPMQQGQDAQSKSSMLIMDLMMPLMTLWMAFNFSAMLGLYWMYQSLLGLGQSFILAKAMPLPKFTDEEIREMNRQQKEAEKAAKAAVKTQPKYKSLHYIDDEDYEELPTLKTEDEKKTSFSSDVPEIKD